MKNSPPGATAPPLGQTKCLIWDARYEKVRYDRVVRDVAVFSVIGVGLGERRHVLGLSVTLSETEAHWRAFLESLLAHGIHGTTFVVPDDHTGMKAARRAVLGAATWQ
ncbi:transposase [Celeribacter halophilus]|uniref:transposase n=1 Tax=Celeribacter halophilus TaxID=576117 RepID=UPI001C089110|nr:transposase [Celeribacter halophilus]MBU2890832.1 transposase [Celeribacter halophilus]MDO6510003.1 transposase [Celeribacter halophilus]